MMKEKGDGEATKGITAAHSEKLPESTTSFSGPRVVSTVRVHGLTRLDGEDPPRGYETGTYSDEQNDSR